MYLSGVCILSLGDGETSTALKRNPASVVRNASLSSFSSKKGSLLSKNYHLRPIRPISLTSADQLDNTLVLITSDQCKSKGLCSTNSL